ncbi:neuronal acetylcholine receptor subunit alpha-2-like [Liolophura sinensis]|uniref:neuronal acetylcholine receptor subunit alpha-2-like n=1 Tax=Liolophura sinensis TaxID=3198878 RepID=UPI00315977AE
MHHSAVFSLCGKCPSQCMSLWGIRCCFHVRRTAHQSIVPVVAANMLPTQLQHPYPNQWTLCLLLLVGLTFPVVCGLSAEARLYDHLFTGYNRAVRPVSNASETIEVKVGLSIINVLDLDVEAGILEMISWVDFDWVDPSLRWDPANYDDVSVLNLPADTTWVPDIVIVNLVSPPVELAPTRLVLGSDGNIFQVRSYRTKTLCMGDSDSTQHTCTLKFMSWSYDGFKVNIDIRGDGLSFADYIENRKWQITGGNMTRDVVYYSCCVEVFPDVTAVIELAPREKTRDAAISNFSPHFLSSQNLVHFLFSLIFFYLCLCLTSLK